MTSYLQSILEPFLSEPELMQIEDSQDEKGILYTVNLSQADMGPVIGRQGETIKAIRTIVRAAGLKHKQLISIKINEPKL